jgi:AhpD family alkylhydroperoxidase
MSDDSSPADDPAPTTPFVDSYALLGERVRRQYLGYYRLAYDEGVLDRKTKELIALGVSLATGAKNCVEGHLRKAVHFGASRAEIEEVVAVAAGVNAASAVDRADRAYAELRDELEALLGPEGEGGAA